jgi:hypothetical protein
MEIEVLGRYFVIFQTPEIKKEKVLTGGGYI